MFQRLFYYGIFASMKFLLGDQPVFLDTSVEEAENVLTVSQKQVSLVYTKKLR